MSDNPWTLQASSAFFCHFLGYEPKRQLLKVSIYLLETYGNVRESRKDSGTGFIFLLEGPRSSSATLPLRLVDKDLSWDLEETRVAKPLTSAPVEGVIGAET